MAYQNTHDKVIELVSNYPKYYRILDLGCGKGEVYFKLQKLGFYNIDCVDIVPKFKGVKKIDLNKDFPFGSNSYDLVLAIEIIEHIENKYHFFREAHRVCKRFRSFIYSTPNTFNIFNRLYYLLTGGFIEFNKKELPHHINPYFRWEEPSAVFICKTHYNRGFLPLLRLPLPSIFLFGQTVIMEGFKI